MGGAVAKRPFEFVDDLATLIGGETLVGDGGSGDVTAELFQLVALVGLAAGGGMEREAGLFGEQGRCEGFGLCRDGTQRECLLAGIGSDGDPEDRDYNRAFQAGARGSGSRAPATLEPERARP